MTDDNYNKNIKSIHFLSICIILSIIFLIGFIITIEFLPYITGITKIEIIGKNQVIENNTIVYLIETSSGKFYTVSQIDYNRLLLGYCEVLIINKNQITAFNHLHTRCNYTDVSLSPLFYTQIGNLT